MKYIPDGSAYKSDWNDGRWKIIVSYDKKTDNPLVTNTVWRDHGYRMYSDNSILFHLKGVENTCHLFKEYEGSESAFDKGGIGGLIKFLSTRYRVKAYPIGYSEYGKDVRKIYIEDIDTEYDRFFGSIKSRAKLGTAAILVIPPPYSKTVHAGEDAVSFFCKEMSEYLQWEVYKFELVGPKGNLIGYANGRYGVEDLTLEVTYAVQDAIENDGWNIYETDVVTDGVNRIPPYVESEIWRGLRVLGIKMDLPSRNIKPKRNEPRSKKTTGKTSTVKKTTTKKTTAKKNTVQPKPSAKTKETTKPRRSERK